MGDRSPYQQGTRRLLGHKGTRRLLGQIRRRGRLGFVRIADTFDFLAGRWRLLRVFDDHHGSSSGCFEAVASLSPEDGTRQGWYLEQGRFAVSSGEAPASRRLRYFACDDGSVEVRFADGRSFYRLDLGRGLHRALHLCGEDRYEIETAVLSPSRLEERWRVRGPGKDYDAVAVLERAGDSSSGHGRPCAAAVAVGSPRTAPDLAGDQAGSRYPGGAGSTARSDGAGPEGPLTGQ